jgi:hypothetical protein
MGMYTGVRARVKIKAEHRAAITKLHEDGDWTAVTVPNVIDWIMHGRCGFIPFGVLAYMPDDFGDPFESSKDEYGPKEGGSMFDGEWWTFSCSLKNYENEIEFFMENIMCHLVEEVDYCESLYEEYPLPDVNPFDPQLIDTESREYWGQFCTNWSETILGVTSD